MAGDLQGRDAEEYATFVEGFKVEMADVLRVVRGNAILVRGMMEVYKRRGGKAGLTRGELVDFLCVDSPSILEMAGFSESEGEEAVGVFEELFLGER